MRLFDTHCHFESTDPAEIRPMLERAYAADVSRLMAVGGSESLNRGAIAAAQLAATGTGLPRVDLALGFDREQLTRGSDELVAGLAALVDERRPTAVGEIGLDYWYSPETRAEQRRLFAAELEFARSRDLPVVIHTREADEDTLGLLREIPSRGVIHCYTGTPEAAKAFLELGFYISISGIVTFRRADNVRAAARVIPDERLLIETDAPFLAPVPRRGERNEPAFVRHTLEFLAGERGMEVEELAELTTVNAERILGK